ncbi:FdtA/QdtA family cupin domain-containing protein [Hymenobacter aerilatus]|uniref:FdtA/QdtA family cupin domain-containing protein n=1 Tax=Hymenobacter aerilatus TaxID=2932251 RepID=A0A8T9SYY1_9BACT|nr:FdtA/QdtA family cupin domain-containing protein [Hymenobacter aerilatus]UOR07288.1 FdtA/QdtA family cupin domain-containing protein [Hymenobacter aerilatus]
MQTPYLLTFDTIGSPDLGYIAVAENSALPFPIKRTYWIYCTPETVLRGHHAHHELQQLVIAVHGRIEFTLENVAGEKSTFLLDAPEVGLFIPEMHWRTINFSHDAVLLCLASTEYNEADYIRSFEEFKSVARR